MKRANIKARSSASASLRHGRERRRQEAQQQRRVAREELLSAKRFKLHTNATSAGQGGAKAVEGANAAAAMQGDKGGNLEDQASVGDLLAKPLSFQGTQRVCTCIWTI